MMVNLLKLGFQAVERMDALTDRRTRVCLKDKPRQGALTPIFSALACLEVS